MSTEAQSLSPALGTLQWWCHTFLRLALCPLTSIMSLHLDLQANCSSPVGVAGWSLGGGPLPGPVCLAYRSATKSSFPFKSLVVTLRFSGKGA